MEDLCEPSRRMPALSALWLAGALALAGCGPSPSGSAVPKPANDAQVPPYARVPYEPFSRETAVAIALREWRIFGSPVVYPNTPIAGDPQRERAEGLWQRVGDYWWIGLPMGSSDQGYTGKHDASGHVFPADQDGDYAWSAAFIDYVMRVAGAGQRFPYAPNHASYINAAREHAMGQLPNLVVAAMPPQSYAPQRGDLICAWRGGHPIRYEDLPTSSPFPGHCNIVVDIRPGQLDTIGGNVDNSVSMNQVPVDAGGHVTDAAGTSLDPDRPWFVVLRVDYDAFGGGYAAGYGVPQLSR
jgi:hypothetical protein